MNARRIHDLMRDRFPTINIVDHDWTNVADVNGVRESELQRLLDSVFQQPELLVEVSRRVGKVLPKHEVVAYLAQHLGQGQIKIANREFTAFAVVAINGVATSWSLVQPPAEACNAG